MHSKGWRGWAAVLATGVCLALVGCGDDDENGGQDGTQPPAGQARVRLIHAAPTAPAVDVYVQGTTQPLFSEVEYGEATDFSEVAAGSYVFELRPAGTPADSPPVYTSSQVELSGQRPVTVVAGGLLGAAAEEQSFRLLALEDDFVEDATPRVRVVHASPDAPPVALDLGGDGTQDVPLLGRFEATGAAGVPVTEGQDQFIQVLAGTPPTPVTSFLVPALPAGARVYIIATGLTERRARLPEGFSLLVVGADARSQLIRQNPVSYVLHASADAPAVDLFIGDIEIADELSFGELSEGLQSLPRRYTVDVFEHTPGAARPATPPLATLETPELVAGQTYLAALTGLIRSPGQGDRGLQLVLAAEAFPEDPSALRVRVVHAAPDVPAVDIGPVEAGNRVERAAPIDDLTFSESSAPEGVPLSGGPLAVGLVPAAATDRTPVARFTLDPSRLAGTGVFAVAAGMLRPTGTQQELRLLLVDTQDWTVQELTPQR